MEVDIQTRGYKRIIIILHLYFTNTTELIPPTLCCNSEVV